MKSLLFLLLGLTPVMNMPSIVVLAQTQSSIPSGNTGYVYLPPQNVQLEQNQPLLISDFITERQIKPYHINIANSGKLTISYIQVKPENSSQNVNPLMFMTLFQTGTIIKQKMGNPSSVQFSVKLQPGDYRLEFASTVPIEYTYKFEVN